MLPLLMASVALAGSPKGMLHTDATVAAGFRPGVAGQVGDGVWKGLWVGGRLSSQQEAYIAAGNLGEFTETGTWHHGIFLGAGVHSVFGRNERWDVEVGSGGLERLSRTRRRGSKGPSALPPVEGGA